MNQISDKKLLELCKLYGQQALEMRRKFLGLLPEVQRRGLYKRKGFNSIFEFAFKTAGVSEEQVRDVLNLEKKFVDKPALHTALVSGAISANKLVRVASIATKENENALVSLIEKLPQKALEVFVREERAAQNAELAMHELRNGTQNDEHTTPTAADKNGLKQTLIYAESVRAQSFPDIKLSREVNERLLELQEKGHDVNAILLELLNRRETEIAEEKAIMGDEAEARMVTMVQVAGNAPLDEESGPPRKSSRYIPVRVRKILQAEHGNKCSIPGCNKPRAVIHHTSRFALAHTHDPRYMAPLCREHHAIAHTIDLNYQQHIYEKK